MPDGAFSAGIPDNLSAGEIEALSEGSGIVIKMASQPLLRAASATAGKSLEVGCNGYVKYCGYSIGVKYVTSPGDYHNHLVDRETIRIGGNDYPYSLVKPRFLKLDSTHLGYVINCMKNTTTKIKNIKAYIITALYNATCTIKHYYQQEVQHDMYDAAVI